MAIVENGDQPHIVESEEPIGDTGFQHVALVLDNDSKKLRLYNDVLMASMDSVTYSGFGPLTFGHAETINSAEPFYYTGRMLQGRLWYRALDLATLNRYAGKLLTGYELGLAGYYPMNDGTGAYAADQTQGAHLILEGASWAQPEGMALKIDNSMYANDSIAARIDGAFRIKTLADWETFRQMVETAKGQQDVNAKLMENLKITDPVTTPYRGDFNGNGHTLVADFDKDEDMVAPFKSIVGNTVIRNLTVGGSIKGARYAAGIAGDVDADASLLIANCRVSATITTTDNWAGGFVGHAQSSHTTVRNCLFDGSITNTGTMDDSAVGAFIGWGGKEPAASVENCLEDGTYTGFRNVGANFDPVWDGTNNWTYKYDGWDGLGHVLDVTTEQLLTALGSYWTVNDMGEVVPRITDYALFQADKPKGLQLKTDLFERDDEQDYTLMFWFRTAEQNGTLMANGSGRADDEGARNKFFIGFENHTLLYRSNGHEYSVGDLLCNDSWHHFAMTVNRPRDVATIYVDNEAKAQFTTDELGGMLGTRFFIGSTVWQISGNPTIFEGNPFTGYIDGLALFEQALPVNLIKRYSTKSPGGEEHGLKVYMDFDHQELQRNGQLALMPYALSKVVKRDNDGNDTKQRDSVFVDSVDKILSMIDHSTGAPLQASENLRTLKFDFVGRNNQLLVNIDEKDARINKQQVYVTLYDIPDKNGNFMASPATECFFVDRNPLRWQSLTNHRTITMKSGTEDYMYGSIVNESGKEHTYTIENLPRWMTVSKISGAVAPMSSAEVTFTVSKNLDPGTYDQIIYLVDESGMTDPLYLTLTVEGEEPDWAVDPSMKRFSMNIVAQVYVGNTLVTDKRDKVAAFDENGRCMGVNNIKYDPATDRSMLYMTIYDSTTVANQLFFRLWHYATGKTMRLGTSETVFFADQAIVGTVDEPVRMYADDLYQQTIDLAQGWNWVSFNVYNAAFERLQTVLNRFPWQENDILTEDSEGLTLVYKKGQWMSTSGSNIKNIPLSQARSYRIFVQNAHEMEIWGRAFRYDSERTITVKQGWNSIGYTPLVNLPVSTALSDYFDEATPGDVVKNQHEFAMFTADGKGGGQWTGTLEYMKPGEGYMIHRLKADTVTFTYPFYEPGTTFIENSVFAAPKAAGSPFPTTMSIVAEAVGIALEDGDRLVAYAGGEEVGEAPLLSPLGGKTQSGTSSPSQSGTSSTSQSGTSSPLGGTVGGSGLFFLSIAGDVEAPLSFAIMRDGETIATTEEVMTYKANGISGSPDEPTQISFVKADELPQQGWYTLDGIKLPAAPKRSGVYIFNGKKRVIK